MVLSLIFFTVIIIKLAVGLSARKLWLNSRNPGQLSIAVALWPWDCQWQLFHLETMLGLNNFELSNHFSTLRLSAWPEDPESHLIRARYFELTGQSNEAINYYRRAVVTVKNGRCYLPAFNSYLNMISQSSFDKSIPLLTEEELSACK